MSARHQHAAPWARRTPAKVDAPGTESVICRQGNGFGRDPLRPDTVKTGTFNLRVRKTP